MASFAVPTSGSHVIMAGALAIALGSLCLGTAVILIQRQRRRSPREVDLEAGVKNDRASTGFGRLSCDLQIPARVKIAASSRLRDSVLGRAIGQLPRLEAGKLKRTPLAPVLEEQIVDIEATAGLDKSTDVAKDADPETTMCFPEWVRPHPAGFREQARKEWSVYIPGTGLVAAASLQTATVIPDIVVQSPTEPQLPCVDSVGSIYSQESWEGDLSEAFDVPLSPWTPELDASSMASSPDIDSPVLETPTMENCLPLQLQATLSPAVSKADMSAEASYYWPLLPRSATMDHLQVPPATWNGPVREEQEVTTVSMTSGKPFMLHLPASTSASSTVAQSRRSTIVLGQSPHAGNVGLGLKSGTSGALGLSLSPSSSLSEALDIWAREMDAYTYEPLGFRVASDSRGGLAYDDADGRMTRRHSVHGYGYL